MLSKRGTYGRIWKKKIDLIELTIKEIKTYSEAKYKVLHTPFLLINNEKSKEELKKSTPTEKGVDTMKKNCYKRTDGRWQYSKQINGMLYYTIANTYRELIDKIKEIKPRKIKETKTIKNKKLTFIEYYSYFYDNYVKNTDVSKSTLIEWQGVIQNYIKPNFQRIELEKLTTEQLQTFINKITKERTRDKVFQKTKRVLLKAYVTGKIKRDITLGLEKPKRKNKLIKSPLTLEEQQQFVREIKNKDIYTFAMFSLIVGSRREETLRFNLLTDINEQKQTIHIKGTKTENADRQVYVSKEFIEFLKQNMKKSTFNLHPTTATKKIKEVFNKLNIDKTLHELRHTCSANLYFLGAKDKYRQMQLGHSSIKVTNDIYTHIKENIPKSKLLEIYGNLYPKFD